MKTKEKTLFHQKYGRAFLEVQWSRISLSMQETRVQSGKHATEQLSPCATTTDPVLYSPGSTATKALVLRIACAPQQEKPRNKKPTHHNQRVAPVCQNWRKVCVAMKTQHSQK